MLRFVFLHLQHRAAWGGVSVNRDVRRLIFCKHTRPGPPRGTSKTSKDISTREVFKYPMSTRPALHRSVICKLQCQRLCVHNCVVLLSPPLTVLVLFLFYFSRQSIPHWKSMRGSVLKNRIVAARPFPFL